MEQARAREMGAHRPERSLGEPSAPVAPVRTGAAVSVEAIAWVTLVAGAALLRLAGLADAPLTAAEASRSLDQAAVARGDTPAGWAGDAAAALTSYAFRIFGETALTARLLPALAGAALVAALALVRPYAGRASALAAAVLIGFSPLFVLVSRSAGPFSTGSLLAAGMAASLFAYLREPRAGAAFAFAVCAALAPLTDAVAVTALVAVLSFLAIETAIVGDQAVGRAWAAFRSTPTHWASASIVLVGALQLGLTHFGTSLDNTGLAGIRLWSGMFETPGDGRAPEYHLALLLAYDWPILLAGAAGVAAFALRLRPGRQPSTPFHRFLVVWIAVAALALAFATRREAGQLLALLLPLAILAGMWIDELLGGLDWGILRRWWPLAAGSLVLAGYSALLMTEWSAAGAAPLERFAMVIAAGGAVLLSTAPLAHLGQRAAVLSMACLCVLASAFIAHSSLAVALGGGAEFAVDTRVTSRTEHFRETLEQLAEDRDGAIVIDPDLRDLLGWSLRDTGVVFGGALEGASLFVGPEGQTPPGFTAIGDPWLVAQGWYPEALLRPRSMWRWLLYREPYWSVEAVYVLIYVPTI